MAPAGAHQERRPQRGGGAHQNLEAVLHLANHLHALFPGCPELSLMAMMLGCSLSADHRLHRNIDAGGLRPVVNDERDFGLVGHGAEVEHLRFVAD